MQQKVTKIKSRKISTSSTRAGQLRAVHSRAERGRIDLAEVERQIAEDQAQIEFNMGPRQIVGSTRVDNQLQSTSINQCRISNGEETDRGEQSGSDFTNDFDDF